jgi:hypothetical protein
MKKKGKENTELWKEHADLWNTIKRWTISTEEKEEVQDKGKENKIIGKKCPPVEREIAIQE